MKSKELLFEIDQLRIKMDYEIGSQYIEESIELINQFKTEACRDIAHEAWIQALKKATDSMCDSGFSKWFGEYMKKTN